MNNNDVLYIAGFAVSLISFIGGIVVRDRQVMRSINSGDSKLHERVDKVRDEYVRKDDLNAHIAAWTASMDRMHETQNETNKRIENGQNEINRRIDSLLAQSAKAKT